MGAYRRSLARARLMHVMATLNRYAPWLAKWILR
jgi:hypothetical protein